jgi:hypothetical protein
MELWRGGLCLSETGKAMSYYAYLGPLGEVVRHGASFVASKDGFPIGTYSTFGEALESLAWKGRTKAFYSPRRLEVFGFSEFPVKEQSFATGPFSCNDLTDSATI